jgi:hypothetical protein
VQQQHGGEGAVTLRLHHEAAQQRMIAMQCRELNGSGLASLHGERDHRCQKENSRKVSHGTFIAGHLWETINRYSAIDFQG